MINPFVGYLDRLFQEKKKVNPTHEIVNLYFKVKGLDTKPKGFYTGRYAYPKLAREARNLLNACDGKLEDALWSIDQMKYKAEKGGFDWSISTCLKHNLK